MESALRACCAGIPIGKVLIRGDACDKELVYKKLPADIDQRHVLLMDPVISSGETACSAIDVLLNEGVDEGSIVLLTLIASPEGVHKVCSKYRRLRVITSEVDTGIDKQSLVMPGVGDFGDRYFGTVAPAASSPRRSGGSLEHPA